MACIENNTVVGCHTDSDGKAQSVFIAISYDNKGKPKIVVSDLAGEVVTGADASNTKPGSCTSNELATEDYYWVDADGNFTQFTGYYDVANGEYVATSGTAPTGAGTDVRVYRPNHSFQAGCWRIVTDGTPYEDVDEDGSTVTITPTTTTTQAVTRRAEQLPNGSLAFVFFDADGNEIASDDYPDNVTVYDCELQAELPDAEPTAVSTCCAEYEAPIAEALRALGVFTFDNSNYSGKSDHVVNITLSDGSTHTITHTRATDGTNIVANFARQLGAIYANLGYPFYGSAMYYDKGSYGEYRSPIEGSATFTNITGGHWSAISSDSKLSAYFGCIYLPLDAPSIVDFSKTGSTYQPHYSQVLNSETGTPYVPPLNPEMRNATVVVHSDGTRKAYDIETGATVTPVPDCCGDETTEDSGGTTAIAPQTYWGLDATGAVIAGSTFTGYLDGGEWYKVAPDGTVSVYEPTADVVSIEEIVGGSVETTAAVDPTSIPYVMDVVADDPYDTGVNTANTLKASANQLPDGILEDDQSSRNYADVIVFNGESVASTAANFTMTNVDFERRDAFIHIPATYRGNLDTVVKKVTLRDNGSGTGIAELLLSLDGQALTMDKGNTSVVLTQGGQFEIDPSQFGGFVYAIAQTDSSIDIKMDIDYIDASGNYQTVTELLTNYLRNPDEPIPQGTIWAQAQANLDSVAGQWTDTDGDVIPDAIMSAVQNKQLLPVAQTPISGSLYYNTVTDTVTTNNVFGGSGTYTDISWDGGITWEPLTDLTVGDTSFMVSPRVRDSNGLISARLDWASNVDDTLLQWNLNTTDADPQATSLVGVGGWETFRDASGYVGGSLKGEAVNTLSTPDIYEAWNAGLFGYGSDNTGTGTAVYLLDATHNPTGETIAFWGKGYQNRQGSTGEMLELTVSVYEQTTDTNGNPVKGALIGTLATWDADNTALFDGGASVTNVEFNSIDTFTGTGTDVWVEAKLLTGTSDGAGHWWGLLDAYFYKDPQFGRVDTSAYLYRNTAASIRWNNTDGVLVTNEHINTDNGTLKPQFNFAYSGLVDGEFTLDIEYNLDGGGWVSMLSKDELTTSNGQADISYFLFDEGIAVTEGSTIQYRINHTNQNNGWLQLSATNTLAKLHRD